MVKSNGAQHEYWAMVGREGITQVGASSRPRTSQSARSGLRFLPHAHAPVWTRGSPRCPPGLANPGGSIAGYFMGKSARCTRERRRARNQRKQARARGRPTFEVMKPGKRPHTARKGPSWRRTSISNRIPLTARPTLALCDLYFRRVRTVWIAPGPADSLLFLNSHPNCRPVLGRFPNFRHRAPSPAPLPVRRA